MYKSFKKQWQLWVLILPLLIWLVLFAYRPLKGILIAFQDYSPFLGSDSPYIGLDNFKELMFGASNQYFWRAFRNTIVISLYGLIIGFPIPIIMAVLFHEIRNASYRKFAQTAVYVPHFISEVIVCSMVVTALGMNTGLINVLLEKIVTLFGGDYNQIHFLADSGKFRMIYTLTGIWKESGFASIIYFAALCGIPNELYEAAKVDGAGRFRQIWSVSLPGILPTIVIMLIIRIGKILNVGYERVLLLYNPGIYDKADILSTYTYRLGIQAHPDFGLSTAASLLNCIIGFTLVVFANKFSKRFSESTLW